MKMKALLLSVALVALLLVGCDQDAETSPDPGPTENISTTGGTTDIESPSPTTPNATKQPEVAEGEDAITSASIVDNEGDFEKAMGKDGTWIICTLKDLTYDKELVLEGEFKNSRDEIQRKIALYEQDENRTVTKRYTLTAPKLTIRSPLASIQHGIFKGDLYVETTDFELVDNKVEGNIYFISEEAKTGFKMDAESSVSGKQEVKK